MLVGLRSRRQIAPFTMHRPTSVQEALALADRPGQAVFMAGGIDLIDWLKYGNAVDRVIRLDGIEELAAISASADGLRIGAMVTHEALIRSEAVAAAVPDWPVLWQAVANPRVRFTGTIGGNVMARKPEYDALPALLALGAEAELDGARRVPLDAPVAGLLTAFHVPVRARLFADRSLRPALSVWCGVAAGGPIRVAVAAAHRRPVCLTLPPDAPIAANAAQVAERLPEPVSDSNASAAYRRRMAAVLTRRLLIRAAAAS